VESHKILKNLISTDDQKKIIKEIIKDLKVDQINRSYNSNFPIIDNPKYWDLITNERLLDAIRDYFNEKNICFISQTSLQYNSMLNGFHRDNADRDFNIGPDWDETQDKYKIVRVGIYLSETSKIPFSILPHSNKKEGFFQKYETKIYNKFISKMRKFLNNQKFQPPSFSLFQKHINYSFDSGDCIFFDSRTLHQGGKINFDKPKFGIFFAYGVKNVHFKNFNNFLRNYKKNGEKKIFYLKEDYSENFKNYLHSKNLL
jgi:hypothetical protein